MELLDDFASNALYSNGGEAPARLGRVQMETSIPVASRLFHGCSMAPWGIGTLSGSSIIFRGYLDVPLPTYPYGKSLALYSGYLWAMGFNPQESLENTINIMGTLLGVHQIVP